MNYLQHVKELFTYAIQDLSEIRIKLFIIFSILSIVFIYLLISYILRKNKPHELLLFLYLIGLTFSIGIVWGCYIYFDVHYFIDDKLKPYIEKEEYNEAINLINDFTYRWNVDIENILHEIYKTDEYNYQIANDFESIGEYKAAIIYFINLDNYKDSIEHVKYCYEKLYLEE